MIKFKASPGDRTLYAFGLSRGNFELLKKGNPIHVNMEEMGMPGVDFMIFGDAEMDDRELADHVVAELGADKAVVHVTGSTDPRPRH